MSVLKKSACTVFVTGILLMALGVPAQAAKVTFQYEAGGAGAVFLAGEFNGWSDSANPMTGSDGVWTLVLDLAPGTYQYKFVIDGSWKEDPDNPNTTDDGFGGKNSVLTVPADVAEMAAAGGAAAVGAAPAPAAPAAGGKVKVNFRYEDAGATAVYLAGDFNGWSDSAELMDKADGVWTKTLELKPGDYAYKFVADGSWTQDPVNPNATDDGFGGQNSLVHVAAGVDEIDAATAGGGAAAGAAAAMAPGGDGELRSVEFRYTPVISGVTNVFLAGTFNDWNDSKTRMTDGDSDGTYTVTLLLAQGTYQYKFVVDGTWHQDPNNPEGVDDGFGGQNSVLVVDASF